jgi:hypothetical protein
MSKIEERVKKYAASEAVKALNPGYYQNTHQSLTNGLGTIGATRATSNTEKPVISNPQAITQPLNLSITPSTDEQRLNKLEKRFLTYLRQYSGYTIWIQAFTFKLGDDCRYSPDFVVLDETGKLTAYETKGFFRDDAKVKIKVAARMFRCIKFTVVTEPRGGFPKFHFHPINP